MRILKSLGKWSYPLVGIGWGLAVGYLPTLLSTFLLWTGILFFLMVITQWVWKRWGWRGRLGAAGGLVFVVGTGLEIHKATNVAGAFCVWAGFGLVLLALLTPALIRAIHAKPATKVTFVLAVAFLCALPVVLVSLATNGSVGVTLRSFEDMTGIDSRGWSSWAEAWLLLLVPEILIGAPVILRSHVKSSVPGVESAGNGEDVGVARIRHLVPSWIAIGAALATGIYGFMLHFGDGPLARFSLPQLTVAVILAVMLLVPPYRLIARAFWNRGVAETLNPERWRADWRRLISDVNETFYFNNAPNVVIRSRPQRNTADPEHQDPAGR